MKGSVAIILLVVGSCLAVLPGCQSSRASQPGAADLRVTVRAEPKRGAAPFQRSVPTYDRAVVPAAPPAGDFALVDYAGLEGIVVCIEPADRGASATRPSPPVVVTIRPAPTPPPLSAAVVGQPIEVVNAGGEPVEVYSVSEGNAFDLGVLRPGERKSQPTMSPGMIELIDGRTYAPVARVCVVRGHQARLTRAGTPVTFNALPPGDWKVAAWHERLPGAEQTLRLAPGKVRRTDLAIGVNALPKVK